MCAFSISSSKLREDQLIEICLYVFQMTIGGGGGGGSFVLLKYTIFKETPNEYYLFLIGRARALHWAVQSIFCVILYIINIQPFRVEYRYILHPR